MLIAVDFDGTIVEHRYPEIGKEIPFATATLKQLIRDGHRLILWTVRTGDLLDEAVAWCHKRGVDFYAVNKSYPEEIVDAKTSRKIKADVVIDDINVGGLPDWGIIYEMIRSKRSYREVLLDMLGAKPPKRKHWWSL